MGWIYTINVSDEFVRDCLNKEINKSGLITSLLHDYYKSRIVGYMNKEQLEDYKSKISKEEKKISQEKEQLNDVEKKLLNMQVEKEEQDKNNKEKQEKLRIERIKTFASYLQHFFVIDDAEAERLARIYEDETDKSMVSLYEFGESMQLVDKGG